LAKVGQKKLTDLAFSFNLTFARCWCTR